MGVSIDSVHSHANWGRELGGVSFPLLSDFEPKGALARSYGHYLAEAGITDRATVIVDKNGVIRYSKSVTPAGARDIDELLAECERINAAHPAEKPAAASSSGNGCLPAGREPVNGTKLFIKSSCGFSQRALLAIDNLHLQGAVDVRNISEDSKAKEELETKGGRAQAPCLLVDGKAMYEAADIVLYLAARVAPVCGVEAP